VIVGFDDIRRTFGEWAAAARANRLFRFGMVGASLITILDQATKYVIVHVVNLPDNHFVRCAKNPVEFCHQIQISPIFDLTYVENKGASFGLLAGELQARVIVLAIDLALAVWLAMWLRRRGHLGAAIGVGALFALGVGASLAVIPADIIPRLLLSLISLVVAGWLTVWLARLNRPLSVAGVALIIGGAVGNLFDRVAYGHVVDFLDFSGLHFPWVFNFADAAINVGVALLALDWLRERYVLKRGSAER